MTREVFVATDKNYVGTYFTVAGRVYCRDRDLCVVTENNY